MTDQSMTTRQRMRKTKGTRRSLKPYTVLRCPFNHFQLSACRGYCVPVNGRGVCGRIAPHQFKGRIQQAIIDYNAMQARRAKQAGQSA